MAKSMIEEYVELLDVAIARGEALGYADDDYRERYRILTGRDYRNE